MYVKMSKDKHVWNGGMNFLITIINLLHFLQCIQSLKFIVHNSKKPKLINKKPKTVML